MSQATYLQDMMSEPVSDVPIGPSEVASFYADRNVFLTGGTGFLGRLLIERILRSCSDINTLFLLVREKKNKSPSQRIRELFDDVVFGRLKRERPGFNRKVQLIDGDMAQVGLGLSSENRERLRSTHIVIHCAATVRFDEKLRIAANINVRGTEELLLLAKEMLDLKAFVYISTAYSNCVSHFIQEKFYPVPIDSDKLQSLVDILDDASLDHLTPILVGKWPNTYAFTKAIAEDSVRRHSQDLPVCVVRPSIVIATAKEPFPGWINNVYGATGILIGTGIGLLRTLHCDPDLTADLIPADFVVNNVIVAAWDIGKDQKDKADKSHNLMISNSGDPPVCNVVSSPQKPLTWGGVMHYASRNLFEAPSMMCIWYYCFTLNKHRWVHDIYVILLHLIPAIIADNLARLTGQKPMLWTAYKKITKFSTAIEYFTTNEWKFDNHNFVRLMDQLTPADRSIFDLNIRDFDWAEYSYHHIRGLRVHILKDPIDTLSQAHVRYAKLKVAHYSLITVLSGILLWLLWGLLRLILW